MGIGDVEAAQETSQVSPHGFMRVRDLLLAVSFLVFWLAPVLYAGVTQRDLHSWLPARCQDQYRITCLFIAEHRYKLEFYVQAAHEDGSWFTLLDSEYTPMRPFGYVNRNWALMYGVNDVMLKQYRLDQRPRTPETIASIEREQRELDLRKPRARELAAWYLAQYRARNPTSPALASVRFLAVWHPVGSEIASPDGHWQRSRVEDLPEERISVIFRRNFVRGVEVKGS